METARHYTAFAGVKRVATGEPGEVAAVAKRLIRDHQSVLVFDDATGAVVDLDPPPPPAEEPRGRGRPKLGVVAREVTLLPRHWEWLSSQPGGASVALRKLVEAARTQYADRDRIRRAQEAADRFMRALAGDFPGYEEASRALYARKRDRFSECISAWPDDVREHALRLAAPVFD